MSSAGINKGFLRQVTLISSKSEPIKEALSPNGYYVTWCSFELDKIMELRDHSNVMILNIADEDDEKLKRIGLYLRDLCIEEEKILYVYGRLSGVDIIRSHVPAIYIRKAVYFYSEPFTVIIQDLKDLTVEDGLSLPNLLIIDDDSEYIERIRPNLDPYFRIYVSHLNLNEAGALLQISDVVLINADASYILIEFLELFKTIYRRKISAGLRMYYLTADNETRDRMNLGSERDSLALSKSVDVIKTANFLIRSCI